MLVRLFYSCLFLHCIEKSYAILGVWCQKSFSSCLHLKWNGELVVKSVISIIDVLGRELLRKEVTGNEVTLTGLALAQGEYLVRVVSGGVVFVARVVGGE